MTAQVPEVLIINQEKYSMFYLPTIPTHTSIKECEIDAETFIDAYSTANMRQYVAVWQIIDNKLYLKKITGCYKLLETPIFADWITAKLVVKFGNRIKYVHSAFDSIFENELVISVKKGEVISERLIQH